MTYVVVGTGEAGVHAALALRANGYAGALLMIGEEPHVPYTRPPLSKSVLTSAEPSLPAIRSGSQLSELRIDVRTGVRVVRIDPAQRRVTCSDGADLGYAKLVLATGARARRLQVPGMDSAQFQYLRTFDDAISLKSRLRPGADICLVGGGYIGLEIAASAVQCGCRVTVVESAPEIMSRVVAPEVAGFFRQLHEAHGVGIRTGARIVSAERRGERIEIACHGSEPIGADLVVAGVGAEPCTELAEEAGLAVDNGIVVDEYGRSSDPDILACGDVANHPNRILGRRLRLESWQNAQQQATVVGAALAAGTARPYASVPWFWSDQHDVNLQMIGCPVRWDDVVMRGDPGERSFTAVYLHRGAVVAGNAINRPKDIPPIRSAIEKGLVPQREILADSSVPLVQAFRAAKRSIEDVT